MPITFKVVGGNPYRLAEEILDKYKQDVERSLNKITTAMAKKAQYKFNQAEYDGNNDVNVFAIKVSPLTPQAFSSYKVVAESLSGSVAFIEFGAGLYQNINEVPHPMRETTIPQMSEIGFYGVRGRDDWWVYVGYEMPKHPTSSWGVVGYKSANPRYGYNWTQGNRPARAMWGAHLEFAEHFDKYFTK